MCTNLKNLLFVERQVIEDNIDYHAWCNKIEDKTLAKVDFIDKYGWIMKTVYCKGVCPHSATCELISYGTTTKTS